MQKIRQAQKYKNISVMVEDLQSGALDPKQLAGDIIRIPKSLGLRNTLKEGRMVRFTTSHKNKKGVIFFVGGLFNGAEKMLSNESFVAEHLQAGFDVIYLEMSQGYVAAKEIINNDLRSPTHIDFKEQQNLLAYYILKSIEKYKIPLGIPKFILGHSYGGWLINTFASRSFFNGDKELENKYLLNYSKRLKDAGLVSENPFSDLLQGIIPIDAGLGSLHLGHPVVSKAKEIINLDHWIPLKKLSEGFALSYSMRRLLVAEYPQLNEDPHGLDNSVALYLGIKDENVVDAPKDIPRHVRIIDLVAGSSELIPRSWHRHYSYALRDTSENPLHRSSLIVEKAPHDFLYMKGLGKTISQILKGEFSLKENVNRIKLTKD